MSNDFVTRDGGIRTSHTGRPSDRPSQNAQVLAALRDGRWHTSREIHQRVFCILHSRIAELRRRGYVIEHRGGGAGTDVHEYRLLSSPLTAPTASAAVGAVSGGMSPPATGEPSPPVAQLSLLEATG